VLKEEGFIEDYLVSEEPRPGLIRVTLKYAGNRSPVIQGIKRISKPSLRVYVGQDEITQVRTGLGISIITTSRGVMTGKHARKERIGGEVLCEVW
jgi:small subunit ribosomal protein S8